MDIEQIKIKITNRVLKFLIDNKITCGEEVYQCDWIIENAYSFIEELCEIAKPILPDEY